MYLTGDSLAAIGVDVESGDVISLDASHAEKSNMQDQGVNRGNLILFSPWASKQQLICRKDMRVRSLGD